MKKFLLTGIIASLALIFLPGCQKERVSSTPESISVRTEAGAQMSPTAGVHHLTLDATSAWTAISECDWITVSPESGERGVNEVTLTYGANSTGAGRKGTVRFTAGSYSETYTLEQSK